MTVQASATNANFTLVLSGEALSRSVTLLTDAGRTTALVYGTLMAKVAATQKWVPFTSEVAIDGSAIPQGIFVGNDVTAAALVAGDVVDVPVLVGGLFTYDNQQLVIENSKLLTTVVPASNSAAVYLTQTVADYLECKGIFSELTVDIDGLEN